MIDFPHDTRLPMCDANEDSGARLIQSTVSNVE